MVISNTLLIKHLPNVLTESGKEELLKHFGAREVKCITSKRKKHNLVFARFENKNVAENILHRLHQINVLGSTLSVEFAKSDKVNSELPKQPINYSNSDNENERCYKHFINKLSSWHSGVDFTQPVPVHLKYQYPPPDMQALSNIIKLLVTVPKFYTQVLHLMNKMNLPCPFGREILPDIQLPFFSQEKTSVLIHDEVKSTLEIQETSESEISSDEEMKKQKETIPEQYNIKKKTKIKIPKFLKPMLGTAERLTKQKKTLFEEVFEKVNTEKEPTIQYKKIKLSQPLSHSELEDKSSKKPETSTSGFGYIHPVKKFVKISELIKDNRDEMEEERLKKEEIVCISEKELAENRISEKDRSVLTVFKNYAEGAPTCRLYIKNLAKTVTEQDLQFIYNRYLAKSGDEPNMFDIRLMQEGRMKGQAFITLQTVELAQTALRETNGYLLKDKPLVVQFARSNTK